MSEQTQKTLIAKAMIQATPEEQTYLRMGKYHEEIHKGPDAWLCARQDPAVDLV
jgi:hypothetical protein